MLIVLSCMETSTHMVPKRDKTNHKESTWPRSDVSAVMYSVGSHDLFLALCHRTVPSERGEKEALLQLILSLKKHLHLQPASTRGEPDSHYCHYVVENELCVCVCVVNVLVDLDVATCHIVCRCLSGWARIQYFCLSFLYIIMFLQNFISKYCGSHV